MLHLLALIVPEISTFIRTNGHSQIDSAFNRNQEYIYFIWSETLSSTCYILFNQSSIPLNLRVTVSEQIDVYEGYQT